MRLQNIHSYLILYWMGMFFSVLFSALTLWISGICVCVFLFAKFFVYGYCKIAVYSEFWYTFFLILKMRGPRIFKTLSLFLSHFRTLYSVHNSRYFFLFATVWLLQCLLCFSWNFSLFFGFCNCSLFMYVFFFFNFIFIHIHLLATYARDYGNF